MKLRKRSLSHLTALHDTRFKLRSQTLARRMSLNQAKDDRPKPLTSSGNCLANSKCLTFSVACIGQEKVGIRCHIHQTWQPQQDSPAGRSSTACHVQNNAQGLLPVDPA